MGMDVNNETLEWWKKQSPEAKYDAFEHPVRTHIKDALLQLKDFVKGISCFWANSPNFDYVILENAYTLFKIDVPWKFWQLRDCRTVYDIGKVNMKTICKETKHNALEDCYYQIKGLQKGLKNIKNRS
jgi:hypothetical protein